MGSGKGGGGGRARVGGGGGAQKVAAAGQAGGGTAVENLPQPNQDIISAYTGKYVEGLEHLDGMNAEDLNEVLREWGSGAPFDPTNPKHRIAQRYMDDLNESLDKIQPHTKGNLYRVIDDGSIASRPNNFATDTTPRHGNISDLFQEGRVSHFDDFLSTSKSPNSSYKPYEHQQGTSVNAPIRLKITSSHSGRDIQNVSRFKDEKEVLFGTGKKFLVTSKKWNTNRNTWDITMEEL
jgi:hypothetical protein